MIVVRFGSMNRFSDIYLHIIFSVKYRDAAIGKYWMPELHSYIASVFNANGHKAIIVGGVEDHVHVLVRYNIAQPVAEIVKAVKQSATAWINAGHHTMCKFAWQKGYGVFSYSRSQIDSVVQYIKNQEQHHHGKNIKFVDEFKEILVKRGIEYNDDYLPKEME